MKSKHALEYFIFDKKLLLFFLFLFFFTQNGAAQIGISFGYKTIYPKGWNEYYNSFSYPTPYPIFGWEASINYRIHKAKQRRIEIIPSIAFSHFEEKTDIPFGSGGDEQIVMVYHYQYLLQLCASIYIFDLRGDKSNFIVESSADFLKKNIFFELAPLFIHYKNINGIKYSNDDIEKSNGKGTTIGGSFGIGIDLPIFKQYDFSLISRFIYFPHYDRIGSGNNLPSSARSDNKQVFVGCRFRY